MRVVQKRSDESGVSSSKIHVRTFTRRRALS
jgi:hypothetical protein